MNRLFTHEHVQYKRLKSKIGAAGWKQRSLLKAMRHVFKISPYKGPTKAEQTNRKQPVEH